MTKLVLLTAVFVLLAGSAAAQVRTVTDYFLAMPADVYSTDIEGKKITGKAALEKFRRSLIKIEDIRNGYLRLEGPWEGWAEIALFKKKDGSYIIGHAESGCGPTCSGFLKFYRYSAGKWTEITAQVIDLPDETEAARIFKEKGMDTSESGTEHYYRLPRVGTTVRMACNMCAETAEGDFILREYKWDGRRFSAVR